MSQSPSTPSTPRGMMSPSGSSGRKQAAQWLFEDEEIVNCPSVVDGMTQFEIEDARYAGVDLIRGVGRSLQRKSATITTAILFFHRFYQRHSFKVHDFHDVAASSLFLAAKVEEDLISVRPGETMSRFLYEYRPYNKKDEAQLRASVLNYEKILLKTLCFDLTTRCDIAFKQILSSGQTELTKDDKDIQPIMQLAFTLLSDCMCTTLALKYPPDKLAATALFIITSHFRSTHSSRSDLENTFGEQELKDRMNICEEVLRYLNRPASLQPTDLKLKTCQALDSFLQKCSSDPVAQPNKRPRRVFTSPSLKAMPSPASSFSPMTPTLLPALASTSSLAPLSLPSPSSTQAKPFFLSVAPPLLSSDALFGSS